MAMIDGAPALTESFANPDDFGDIHASELHTSLGERLGAQAGEAFMGGVRTLHRIGEYHQANTPAIPDTDEFSLRMFHGVGHPTERAPEIPIADAKDRVKQEGLESHFKLPNQETIKAPVLDLMITHAHERQQYDAAVSRGPQGFFPGALGFVTEIGAGIVDPVNIAAFSVPVVGEARMGMMLARAGNSPAARAGVKAGVGALQGAIGTTALQPADWWLHTRDGVDYTMTDALRSIALGAGMGATAHAGLGAFGDVRALRVGMPLPGSPEDVALRALARAGRQAPPPGGPAAAEGGAVLEPSTPPVEGVGRESTGAISDPVAALTDRIQREAVAAGLSADQAEEAAALLAARYATRAARLGVDPMTLIQRDGETLVRRGEDVSPEGQTFEQRRQRGLEGQMDLPGTGPISDAELAQRRADDALKPKVPQKPMDEGLFSDNAAQKSFFQRSQAPPFFSAVGRAIDNAKQDKASPDQWLGMLKNTPGVKPEEMEWLGLADWLKAQKGSVTKAQVADYVRANAIEVREVERGKYTEGDITSNAWEARQEPDGSWMAYNRETGQPFSFGTMTHDRAWAEEAADNMNRAPTTGLPAKFGEYTLPGGENYRELLLTLPAEQFEKPIPGSGAPGFEQAPYAQRFTSTHFDEPNVVAHIRFDDRVIDGKKTLLVEEVQSDWHQKGKRKGYQRPAARAKVAELEADVAALRTPVNEMLEREDRLGFDTIREARLAIASEDPRQWDLHGESLALAERFHHASQRLKLGSRMFEAAVPDAPFKTTWPELAMKRMIRYAAENGYEKIAWTTGETQAARYDLSKQIKVVRFDKAGSSGFARREDIDSDTSGRLTAFDHNGNQVMSRHVEAAELADHVGKEAAEKLLAQEGSYGTYNGTAMVRRKLEGLDLKVGGEGMKGFYDQILPATVGKLTKKFEGRVGEGTVKHLDDTDRDVPFVVLDRDGTVVQTDIIDENHAAEQAREIGGTYEFDRTAGETKETKVHTLDITPQLRQAAVEQGFPLFQKGGEGAPQGRITFSQQQRVIELFQRANASTLPHEFAHMWLEELIGDAGRADAPAALKADRDAVLKWLGVDRPEDIGTEHHERFARGFEQYLREGKAPSSALARTFERFKQWLVAIYRHVTELGTPISDEMRGVFDRLLATDEEIAAAREHPSAKLADLPARVREDVVRAATADVINGNTGRAGEMLAEAAKDDPRIAESLAGPTPAVSEELPAKDMTPRRRSYDEEKLSLLPFLAARGGIKETPDLRAIFDRNPFIPGFGRLFRKTGMDLDHARGAAAEAGYIVNEGRGGTENRGGGTSTTNDLLAALHEENRGNKRYRPGHEPEAKGADTGEDAYLIESEMDHAFEREGLPPLTGALRARVLELMTTREITDPHLAYERAVMEVHYAGAEAEQPAALPTDIPGWDFPDERGAAPGDRGATAGERQAALGGAGETSRQPGEGNRPPAGKADWQRLADARRPDDEDLARASKAAEAVPEPASTDPAKALSAAKVAAKEAEALLDDLLPRLTDEERALFTDALNRLDQDRDAQQQMVRDGTACLLEAVA